MKLKVANPFKRKASDAKIQAALGDFEIASFPEPVMRVLELLRAPDSSTSDIASWLERDPGLHVHVLRTVNSAAYNPNNPVSGLRQAVSLMGRTRFESLVLGVAVKAVVPQVDDAGFDSAAFWERSVRRGAVARVLCRFIHPASEMEAFTVGLMQDIAVPLLAGCVGNRYVELYNSWLQGDIPNLVSAEQEQVGTDHAAVGEMIARNWQLPAHLSEAIAGHHDPLPASHDEIASRLVATWTRRVDDEEIAALIASCESHHDLERSQLEAAMGTALEEASALF